MNEQIDIWLVGNTGLRNPNRIQEGFCVFANSSFVGKLHGRDNEIGFMNLLNEKGIIQNKSGKDESGSHARKWRLMFAKNGFIYPRISKTDGRQEELGKLDELTPFGKAFLKADTYPAIQECYFSPLRWLLAIMLELEKRTGSSELSRIEFALWGHTTNPGYGLKEVVDNILDLRSRRALASAKRSFDKEEIAKRGRNYQKKRDNFLDYSDMKKIVYDDDNAIEIPKEETPAYLEWVLWRAALAMGQMVNQPYEVRGFRLDSDFFPVSAAGGGKGDLYWEYEDFVILTEVTMSTSSKQEAMEGEPVRRHVSDAVLKYNKPVYGMFIAIKIDTNTAETFRHGIWYAKNDRKQRLDIVPLTLEQFRRFFVAMFKAERTTPDRLQELLEKCEEKRDLFDAPLWKGYISSVIEEKVKLFRNEQ